MVFKRMVVFGGSGFVGSRILEMMVSRGSASEFVSLTRSGKPPHRQDQPKWLNKVEWAQGDSLQPGTFKDRLSSDSAVIISVGSPPLPTNSEEARLEQVKANGETCVSIIEAAAEQGVKRLVLINATMPEWTPSGYREGKELARQAAIKFAEGSNDRGAVILKPSAIYGTRYTEGGMPIPLWTVMAPTSFLMQGLSQTGISGYLERSVPSVFKGVLSPPVSVDAVARAAVDAASMDRLPGGNGVFEVEADDIIAYRFARDTRSPQTADVSN
mmetsp:Transcript_17768/g.35073  ORF Transcript_17768/g.35073 Transcript_17768/m.35073 type:complete len:271 (-) Transcript_17768:347-1159(-)